MINFPEGTITIGAESIIITSDYEILEAYSKKGLIEKRKDPGGDGAYFYVETVADDMRFGVIISLKKRKIEWILLRWLDRPMTGWDNVSEKAMRDEYRLLLNFVEKRVGAPPDNKKNRRRTWRFKWGQVEVTYEPRSFDVVIFMKPR